MADQVFSDAERQLLVTLSTDTLTYTPAGETGWKCRLDDIAWTSSRMGPRVLQSVHLHSLDGRIRAAVPEFEQIERFYVSLLRHLTGRPTFDLVRDSLPTRVELLERVFWLAARTPPGEPWEAAEVEEHAAVVATSSGLTLLPPGAVQVQRIPWAELSGARYRVASPMVPGNAARFYGSNSYVELPLSILREGFTGLCARRLSDRPEDSGPKPYQIPGVECRDPEVAMEFSWEIEKARDEARFEPGETVLACAFGRARAWRDPGSAVPVEPTVILDAISGIGKSGQQLQVKTTLFLTDRRLLRIDRSPADDAVLLTDQRPVRGMPKPRRSDPSLIIGDMELVTDASQPMDMAREFVDRYKGWVLSGLKDPFAPDVEDLPPGAVAPSSAPRPPAKPRKAKGARAAG